MQTASRIEVLSRLVRDARKRRVGSINVSERVSCQWEGLDGGGCVVGMFNVERMLSSERVAW